MFSHAASCAPSHKKRSRWRERRSLPCADTPSRFLWRQRINYSHRGEAGRTSYGGGRWMERVKRHPSNDRVRLWAAQHQACKTLASPNKKSENANTRLHGKASFARLARNGVSTAGEGQSLDHLPRANLRAKLNNFPFHRGFSSGC